MVVRYLPQTELYHYGIKGQKWGVRRYQNPDGSLTESGKNRYGVKEIAKSAKDRYSKYSKIGKAILIGAGIGLAAYYAHSAYAKFGPMLLDKTLSNKKVYSMALDNKEGYSRIFASYKGIDRLNYKGQYGKSLLEKARNNVGIGEKAPDAIKEITYDINKMKIASERSSRNIFNDLISKDADFKSYVTELTEKAAKDPNVRFNKPGIIKAAQNGDDKALYNLFNSYAGMSGANSSGAANFDKFSKALQSKGYSAMYDINDISNKRAKAPIIMLNNAQVRNKSVNSISEQSINKAYKKYLNSEVINAFAPSALIMAGTATLFAENYRVNKKELGGNSNDKRRN